MKDDFNIEDVERKNIYKAPSNFYERVQENVLRETSLKKENNNDPKVKKLNFKWWAVAASVLLMISAGLMWNNFQTETSNENHFAENEMKAKPQPKLEIIEKPSLEIEETKQEKIEVVHERYPNLDKKEYAEENPNLENEKQVIIAQNETTETLEIDLSDDIESIENTQTMEEILSEEIPEEELATLTENMENDIYLELYN